METVKETWGMQCPKCGNDEELSVAMRVWGDLTPDGTDIDGGDHEWDGNSDCICSCGWAGNAGNCRDAWESAQEDEDDDPADFDPENIYGLPGIRQSIEEDRK